MALPFFSYSTKTKWDKLERTFNHLWALVVAQLVERSHPIPEVRSSNPVIGKII